MSLLSQSPNPDVAAFIRANSKNLLGGKFWDTRCIHRVDFGWKPDKLDSRTMVLSKFRVFFLHGKHLNKLQVDASFHLLQIKAIEIEKMEKQVKFSLDDGKRAFYVCPSEGMAARGVVIEMLKAVKHYFPGCADVLRSMVSLTPAELYAEFPSLPHGRPALPCANFRRTYAALCDYYRTPLRDEVTWDVERIYQSHDSRALRLEDFTHLLMRFVYIAPYTPVDS